MQSDQYGRCIVQKCGCGRLQDTKDNFAHPLPALIIIYLSFLFYCHIMLLIWHIAFLFMNYPSTYFFVYQRQKRGFLYLLSYNPIISQKCHKPAWLLGFNACQPTLFMVSHNAIIPPATLRKDYLHISIKKRVSSITYGRTIYK